MEDVYFRLGQCEGKLEDAQAALHRIVNMHACISCYFDAMDDMRHVAQRALERTGYIDEED